MNIPLQPGDIVTVDFVGATSTKRRPAVTLSILKMSYVIARGGNYDHGIDN